MIEEKMVQCIGKHPFEDRALAQHVADQQNRRKDKARVSIYTCQVCGSIHSGAAARSKTVEG